METNETNKMLKAFFTEKKQEISDNGFSRKVMMHLPVQKDFSWIVWLFAVLGMAISLYLGLNDGLIQQLFKILEHIPYYYLLAAVLSIPLVGTTGYYLANEKKIEIF